MTTKPKFRFKCSPEVHAAFVEAHKRECALRELATKERREREESVRLATGACAVHFNTVRNTFECWHTGNVAGGRYFPKVNETLVEVPA